MGAISIRSEGGNTLSIPKTLSTLSLTVNDGTQYYQKIPTAVSSGYNEYQSITSIRSDGRISPIVVEIDRVSIQSEHTNAPFITPNTTQFDLGYFTLNSTGGSALTPVTYTQGGIYGEQISTSTARSTIASGDVGITLPFTNATLFTSISYGDIGDNYAYMWIGFFKPPTTGTYTFYTSSDDGSGVWIGDIASDATGRTASNAVVNNDMGSGHGNQERSGTISLTADVYYPIRIVHEEGSGGSNMTFSWAGPGISKTTDLSQYFYYAGDGSDFAAATTVPPEGLLNQEYSETIIYDTNPTNSITPYVEYSNLEVSNGIFPVTIPTERISVKTSNEVKTFTYFTEKNIFVRKSLTSNLPDDGFFDSKTTLSIFVPTGNTPFDIYQLSKDQYGQGFSQYIKARVIDSTGNSGGTGSGGGTTTGPIQSWSS